MITKAMYPYTDKETWDAYQASAKRIYCRRSPIEQDYVIVALYEALETKGKQLDDLARKVKVALLAAESPSTSAMTAYSNLLRRVGK